MICSRCRKTVENNWVSCPYCGNSLKGEAPDPGAAFARLVTTIGAGIVDISLIAEREKARSDGREEDVETIEQIRKLTRDVEHNIKELITAVEKSPEETDEKEGRKKKKDITE